MKPPGHYCDKEERIMDRLKETSEILDEVFSDGFVAGLKWGLVIALIVAGLAVIFI